MQNRQRFLLQFRSRFYRVFSGLRQGTLKRGRWVAPAALLSGALFLQAIAGFHPATVEYYYSRGIYPHVANNISLVSRFLPFSLAEAIISALLAILVGATLRQAYALCLRRLMWRTFLFSSLWKLLWAAGAGAVLFLLAWGLNYQRPPLAETIGMERREVNADELQEVGHALISETNRCYLEMRTFGRGGGTDRSSLGHSRLIASISQTMQQENLLPIPKSLRLAPPKPIFFSRILTRLGLTGIFIPFTGEPHFNTEQPAFDLPFTMAHEMAHQQGFAREDEANFVAFLVCVESEHPTVRYSGYLNSLSVLGALARDRPTQYSELMKMLEAGPRADLRERSQFWRRHLGRSSELSKRVNDIYLKINRVKAGVNSYGDSTTLIIRYYLSHMRPHAAA